MIGKAHFYNIFNSMSLLLKFLQRNVLQLIVFKQTTSNIINLLLIFNFDQRVIQRFMR